MNKLPGRPGPHKIEVNKHRSELFELAKKIMATCQYLYQFKSIESFIKCLTIDYDAQTYLWNNEEGELVGFFAHANAPEEKCTDELLMIGVHPNFQGKGYGTKMIQFYFDLLENKKKSVLFTHENNNVAIHFYQSLGYKIIKKVPHKYDDGATRLLLEKNLVDTSPQIGGDGGEKLEPIRGNN